MEMWFVVKKIIKFECFGRRKVSVFSSNGVISFYQAVTVCTQSACFLGKGQRNPVLWSQRICWEKTNESEAKKCRRIWSLSDWCCSFEAGDWCESELKKNSKSIKMCWSCPNITRKHVVLLLLHKLWNRVLWASYRLASSLARGKHLRDVAQSGQIGCFIVSSRRPTQSKDYQKRTCQPSILGNCIQISWRIATAFTEHTENYQAAPARTSLGESGIIVRCRN